MSTLDDMVFWHCGTIHSVERGYTGANDSGVVYIPSNSCIFPHRLLTQGPQPYWHGVHRDLRKGLSEVNIRLVVSILGSS
ncbi:hypothetical protein EDC04DRAFT_1618899 [Pisolithus marmoratus]|nr:hypothetical protein EDC04DRAFT_1618899 [Pisolithus marmoratus]